MLSEERCRRARSRPEVTLGRWRQLAVFSCFLPSCPFNGKLPKFSAVKAAWTEYQSGAEYVRWGYNDVPFPDNFFFFFSSFLCHAFSAIVFIVSVGAFCGLCRFGKSSGDLAGTNKYASGAPAVRMRASCVGSNEKKSLKEGDKMKGRRARHG